MGNEVSIQAGVGGLVCGMCCYMQRSERAVLQMTRTMALNHAPYRMHCKAINHRLLVRCWEREDGAEGIQATNTARI